MRRDTRFPVSGSIKFIIEDADTALRVAMDRRRPPFGALRPGHAFLVQLKSDAAGRFAREIIGEDAAHDGGFRLVDRPIAADRLTICRELLHHVIAEAQPATGLAILDPAAQPTARLVGEVFQEEGVHRARHADASRHLRKA